MNVVLVAAGAALLWRVTRACRILWIVAVAVAVGVLAARGAGPEAVLGGLFSSWSGLLFWSPVLPVLSAPLGADVKAHSVRLPRARLRRGLNAIVFTIPPEGRALVDRIVFTRVEGGA